MQGGGANQRTCAGRWLVCYTSPMKIRTLAIAEELAARLPQLAPLRHTLETAVAGLGACHQHGGLVMLCGNGGSAADCMHIAGELMKGFMLRREPSGARRAALLAAGPDGRLADSLQEGVRAVCLADAAALASAVANDIAWEAVFAQQVFVLAKPGDVLIGMSTSGNAANVLRAFETARALGVTTIGFTGSAGGALRAVSDILFAVPETETFRIQELHLPLYHALCAMVEEEIFGTPP